VSWPPLSDTATAGLPVPPADHRPRSPVLERRPARPGINAAAESLAEEVVSAGRARVLGIVAGPLIVLLSLAPAALGQPGALGAVATAVVVGLLVLARSPARLVLLAVALVPVTSGLARGLVVPGLRLSEALTVLAAVSILAMPVRLPRGWTGLDIAVLVYLLLGTVLPVVDLVLVAHGSFGSAALQTVLGPVQFVLLYLMTSAVLGRGVNAVLAQRFLLLASVLISGLAIAESAGPPVVHETLIRLTGTTAFNTQGYTAVPRAASLFPVWLGLAGYLLVVLVLAVALLLAESREVLPRWALVTVIVLGVLGLAASLTVTIGATLVAASLYLGWRNRKLPQVVGLVVAAGVVAYLVFGSLITQRADAQTVSASVQHTGPSWLPETIGYRVVVWEDQYAGVLQRYAATGYGPGFPPGIDWSHTESGYITLLLRGGIPYLAGTVALLVAVVRRARRELALAVTPSRRAVCQTALVIAVVQLPINLTFPYFTASGLPQAAWIVWGLLAAREKSPEDAGSEAQPRELAV
jgi:hypothetical protein